MPGKIFVNYRRDDVPGDARGVRDALAAKFGRASVFMDIDNLLAGQRFDQELAKALDACDVLVAVIGPRWMDLLEARTESGERDYVREEIAAALKRGIVVIPVRVGREGQMPPLPRAEVLPADIRDLVLYQKHDVAHERFGRDMAELTAAIAQTRRGGGGRAWLWPAAGVAAVLLIGGIAFGTFWNGDAVPTDVAEESPQDPTASGVAVERKGSFFSVSRWWSGGKTQDPEENGKRAETRRKAEEVERQRLAAPKTEEDNKRAAAEAKRAGEEAARRDPTLSVKPGSGQSFRDKLANGQPCAFCPEMVVAPGGSFTMGSHEDDSEKPPRRVTIRQPFAVGKFEVTFAEWEACVKGGGCASNRSPDDQGWGKGRRPVVAVSSHEAKDYVSWLSAKTGNSYRLLSEAEWEYAARAGTTTKYAFGDTISTSQARFSEGSYGSAGGTVEVGKFPPNAWGLHDMHGNVYEWCEDNWHPNYQGAPNDGSVWQGGDTSKRVARGGAWYNYVPDGLRSSNRGYWPPVVRNIGIGFRVARTLNP